MIRRENVIKRFIMGMSVLTAYIYYTGNLNMHDINISAEQFMCDLLNILYNMDLKNANNVTYNNSGYDLISENKKIIIQVTVTDTPEKIIRTLNTIKHKVFEYSEWTEKLREIRVQKKLDPSTYTSKVQDDEKKIRSKLAENVNLNDYTLYFMVMKQDATMQRKYKGENNQGYVCIDEVNFDKKNIWDFSTLINKVNSISEISSNGEDDLLTEINHFMDKNINVFGMLSEHGNSLNNKVKSIIKEYADNFTEKLFRHRYVRNSKVTLNRLFVEPKMKVKEYSLDNFIVILDNFLWNETKKRILFIEGDAAIGKTSLVSYLCYHYLEKDDISKAVFLNSDLVCVRLRELDFSDRNKSIQEILLEYLGFETMEKFKTLFADCILILDGADEMSMIEGIHSTGMEDLIVSIRKIFKNNKIIITSRPQFIDTRRFDARNFSIEKAEILHFDKEKRKQWLEKYESCGESVPEKTKEYIINIDDNVASGVADTPLALYLLVACDMREELQGNVWALYHEIFHNAIINTEYNENFDNSLEHPIKDYEEILYKIVCSIAFRMFKNSMEERYYISSHELDEIINESGVDSVIVKWVRKCCVLCAYWKSNGKAGALEFYHNNIRDYFFGEYIYNKLSLLMNENDVENPQNFLTTMCEIMQYGYIAGTTWEQTFLFIYNKLQYDDKNYECDLESMVIFLQSIYTKIILADDTIWTYNYRGYNYQKIKNTLFNTLLLIRVYQKGALIEKNSTKTTFWSSDGEFIQILNSNIFADWCDMFKQKVIISNNNIISIGQNCLLDGLNFENRSMQNVGFQDSSLRKASFNNTNLNGIDFAYSDLSNAFFSGAILEKINFSNALLDDIDFSNATLINCNFTGAKIRRGKFDLTKVVDCAFKDLKVEDVNWGTTKIQRCHLENVKFTNSCLDRIKLRKETINNSEFINCSLKKADLERCNVQESIFGECVLDEIILIGAELCNIEITKTSCRNANLSNSSIEDSQLISIDFENTSFTQAILKKNSWEHMKFRNSDFRHTQIFTDDFIKLKKYDADLRWSVEKNEDF